MSSTVTRYPAPIEVSVPVSHAPVTIAYVLTVGIDAAEWRLHPGSGVRLDLAFSEDGPESLTPYIIGIAARDTERIHALLDAADVLSADDRARPVNVTRKLTLLPLLWRAGFDAHGVMRTIGRNHVTIALPR